MLNPIKEIYNWQKTAGNLDKPYSDFLESSFQIEEALEGFDLSYLPNEIGGDSPKLVARQICRLLEFVEDDVARLDKACDSIVYAIGSIAKLGLDHHGITKALNIVNNANKAKLGMERDEHGKLLKPDDFVGPETELQLLLDSRR